ncbi:MAG: excinuclease ABC subunit UvrA [Rhodothermales bacterium]|nr:excinuclease ABC subunit UvrA [Rhodothermales bacterium]
MDQEIVIRGAREHNLKNIDLNIPRNQLVVVTGLSGSGKSSLAFDTIYAEGQRRYMESLSAYARQFLGMMERPDVDFIDGLSPVISIEQKSVSSNPRSTVGTVTEIYDFLRLLYARASTAYSYISGDEMRRQSDDEIIDGITGFPNGTRMLILSPVVRGRKGHYRELFEQISRQGFERVRVDNEVIELKKGLKVDRYKTHDIEVVVDRVIIKKGIRPRIAQSVDTALGMGNGVLITSVLDDEDGSTDHVFSRHLFSAKDGLSYDDPSPNSFSFNSPYGACPTCNGLGVKRVVAEDLVVPDPELSINDGALHPIGKPRDIWVFSQLRAVADEYEIDFDTPFCDLNEEQRSAVLDGLGDRQFDIVYKYKDREVVYKHRFGGIFGHVWHTYQQTNSASNRRWAESYLSRVRCPECEGGRLKRESLSYRIADKNIKDLVTMDVASLHEFITHLELDGRAEVIARPIRKEITDRLGFLLDVGIDYLSLDRSARSLSGGESQRIRLATQIGTQLVGVLYVLDEPSIGLHPRDNVRLIASLQKLRDLGNSVIVVEHDREMIEAADYVVDLGPGAGEHGGVVMAAGTPAEINKVKESMTVQYITGSRHILVPPRRRAGNGHELVLTGARGHNLKGNDLRIPLGRFIAVTGVSGSGKSSLINQTLYPILSAHYHNARTQPLPYEQIDGLDYVDKVIEIDQRPIGRTPRSNPATYTGLFSLIRDIFAELTESKIRAYKPGRFSFNVKGGRCEACKGAGIVKLEMNFLPDVYVECETCNGRRYNAETLEVRFREKTIADVLEMTVSEALEFFANIPRIARKLRTLNMVGLGYIRLGQQATTLSGGEAQRVKLSKELSRPGTGNTLYILDEPTTGLHFEDVKHLLDVLQALVARGNTVLVIEHNLDVVKVADHIIDLGPEGGESGGCIVAVGTPEEMAAIDTHTGRFLSGELANSVIGVEDSFDLGEIGSVSGSQDDNEDDDDQDVDDEMSDEDLEVMEMNDDR